MIRLLCYTLLAGFFLSSCTQKSSNEVHSATNDSVKKYLDLAGDKTIAFDKRIKYNDKALSYVNLDKNDSLSLMYIYKININLSRLGKIDKLKELSKVLINNSIIAKDSISLFRGYHCLGYVYMRDSKNELAIKYFFKAKKGFSSKGLIEEELKVMDKIATTQSYANDFSGSIKTSFELIKKAKKLSRICEINDAYMNIGNNFSYLKNERKSINYYNKIKYEKDNIDLILSLKANIASSYINLGEYEKAFSKIKDVVNKPEYMRQKRKGIGVINSLLGLYYLKTKRPLNSLLYLKRANNIFKSIDASNGENYNQIYFSEYYAQINDTLNAIKTAQRAIDLSRNYKNPADILLSIEQIIKVDKKNALQHAMEYIRINDSMQISERNFRDKFAEIIYEKDEINKEKDKAISQKWIVIGVSGFIILIIVLLLIITRQRTKQKELQLLQSQQKANEEIYDLMLSQKNKEQEARQNEKKRIALELHDGVMNKLASARLNLDVLHHKRDEQTIEECLGHINEIYKIEQEIRNISHDLSIDGFKRNNSFKGLIDDFLNTQNKTYVTHFKLEMEDTIKWENISSSIKMNLFRIIQEASHNINKFANAKNAVITFIIDANNLCLSVTDDGQGFDVENQTEGIGLKNIKQRVASLKGKCIIQSIHNHSTSINIAIPM
ncbi:ATP-binding protein [Flavobacterium sp. 25HG05S-40]|uniref:ATP-binding protein n=1 Tax=Flavobacterium sp. 25HG05S-40 TaxID=3458682 RepID=UPI004044C217